MVTESRCGICCSACEYRESMGCESCIPMAKPFWGDSCPIKSCVEAKELAHCGQCPEIPCEVLTAMSYEESKEGDNGARIQQCREWHAEALQTALMDYMLAKPGTTTNYKVEWGWQRLQVGEKLFVTFARMHEERPIVTVKLKPEHGDFLRKQYPERIIPGFYMNKEHWNTIYLDTPWELEFFIPLVDEAYDLVLGSLTKKKQKEIMGK